MKIVSPLLLAAISPAATSAAAEPVETEIPTSLPRSRSCARAAASRGLRCVSSTAAPRRPRPTTIPSARSCWSTPSRSRSISRSRTPTAYFIGGPIGDSTLDGGRVYVVLEAGQRGVAWAYFNAIPPGTVVSVELPQMFPFEDVVVTEGRGALLSAGSAQSTPAGAVATLSSAKRADQAFQGAPQAGRRTGSHGRSTQPVLRVQGRLPLRPCRQAQVSAAQGQRGFVPGLSLSPSRSAAANSFPTGPSRS